MSGQAVLDHCAGIGGGHHRVVDLESGKRLTAELRFPFLTHRGPDIGADDIGAGGHLENVGGDGEILPVGFGEIEDKGVGTVVVRAGDGNLHPDGQAADDVGVCHVVAVPDVAELVSLEAALVLTDGHEVGENLAGMAVVGQAVDDRNGAVFRQVLDLLLGKGADHNAVQVAGEDAGGVLHRFAAADLKVAAAQKQRLPAQLVHASLKGDAGAGGRFLENHAERFSGKMGVGDPVFLFIFELVRQIEGLEDVRFGPVAQLQQMFHGSIPPYFTPAHPRGSAGPSSVRRR